MKTEGIGPGLQQNLVVTWAFDNDFDADYDEELVDEKVKEFIENFCKEEGWA